MYHTTAALINCARAPNEPMAARQAAFGMLVERFQDAAYGHAYTLLGDSQLALDAAQEAFIAAYGSLAQLRTPEAFAGWLRQIVRTYCARLRRGEMRLTPLEDVDPYTVDPRHDPAVAVEVRERRAALAAAVHTLPDRERMVVVLFYVVGYPQQEIAELLNVPLTTVKKRLQAARQRLRAQVVSLMDEEPGDAEHSAARFRRAMRLVAAFDANDEARQVLELLLVDGMDVDVGEVKRRTLLASVAALLRRAARQR